MNDFPTRGPGYDQRHGFAPTDQQPEQPARDWPAWTKTVLAIIAVALFYFYFFTGGMFGVAPNLPGNVQYQSGGR